MNLDEKLWWDNKILSWPRAPPKLSVCLKRKHLRPSLYSIDKLAKEICYCSGGYDLPTNTTRLYMYAPIVEIGLMRKAGIIPNNEAAAIDTIIDKIGDSTVHELVHWGAETLHGEGTGLEANDFYAVTAACGFQYSKLMLEHYKIKPKREPLVITEH